MAGDAHRTTVGDYVTLVRGTTYKGTLVGEPGPALLGLGSIEPGGGFRIGNYKTYGGDCPDELMLYPGDIYASLKGATKDGKMIGSVARVPPSIPAGRLTQDTVKLVFRNPNGANTTYLYWVLRTPQYRNYCAGHAMGSAVVALSRRDFLSYSVPQPTAQRRMVITLLDLIEEKIELNRKINETLEALAHALFKDWFVDFGPTRAKMEGRAPYLAPKTWTLFPGSLGPNGAPELWTYSAIGDEVAVVGGTTPSTNEPAYWNGELHWVTPKDLSRLSAPVLMDTERRITPSGLSQIGSGLLPKGAVLLSSRAPIGYLAITIVPTAINQGFIGMICNRRLGNVFTWLWTAANMETIIQKANGSTFQEISKTNFRSIATIIPTATVMSAFDSIVRPIFNRICASELEIRTLTATRDLLLPKLMSGDLCVKDAEKIAAAA